MLAPWRCPSSSVWAQEIWRHNPVFAGVAPPVKDPPEERNSPLSTDTWSPNPQLLSLHLSPKPSPFCPWEEPVRNFLYFRSGTLPFLANKPCFKSKGWHWMYREMLDAKHQQSSSLILWKLVTAISCVRVRMVLIYSQLQIISSYTLLNLS